MSIPMPVIRLEVDHMKHAMVVALSQYTAQMDETLQQAVERFCTPENLEKIIQTETERVLDTVIREEVRHWFSYGEGRETIKKAVEERLNHI